MNAMKSMSRALLAAGVLALGACGGGAEQNVSANAASEEYDVAADDLGAGNEADANAADANESAGNDATGNEIANAAE